MNLSNQVAALERENIRLLKLIDTMGEELENRPQFDSATERDILTLLEYLDKHMELVKAHKDRTTDRELVALAAYTRLREIYPRGEIENA